MRYQLAPLYCRPWTLNGISARLIESHYENNYGAALNRLNAISEEIEQLDFGKISDQSLARLKRDEIVALNSTLLHELYFASLGGDGRVLPDALTSAIAKDFGSVDRWRQEFVGIANGLAGGSGWVLLTYVPRDGRLINQIASDHDQSIAGGVPILALDMYEHAYHLEFGANAGAYIAAFMRNIDWSAVKLRYEDAIKVAPPRPLEQKQFADVPSISAEEVREMLKSERQSRSSTRAQNTTPPRRKISWGERSGVILNAWMTGLAPCQRPNPSSHSVSTASTSDARRRQRCARPGLMPGTWQAGISPGKQSRAR
jgi:superoxide dismutase, Fe-Mn family